MKVLFDNVLLDYDSISSDNESINYPATNLLHEFLEKRYQFNYGASDQITIELTADEYIDSVYFGFTNATRIDFTLYDFYDTQLATYSFTGITDDINSYHFGQSYFTKKIVIDVYATNGAYLGGVGAGVSYDMGNPTSPWNEDFTDNSVVSSSPRGQKLQNYSEPLNVNSWLFRDWTREQTNEIKEIYKSIGVGYNIWVDPFEDNSDFLTPVYAVLSAPINPVKNGRRYDFEFSIEEAR